MFCCVFASVLARDMMRKILDMCDDILAVLGKWLGEKNFKCKVSFRFLRVTINVRTTSSEPDFIKMKGFFPFISRTQQILINESVDQLCDQ